MAKCMVPKPTRVLRSQMKSPSKPAPVQEPKVIRKRTAKAAPKTQGNFVRETGNHGRYTQEQEGFEMKNIANEVQDINVQNQEIREQESFEMVQVVLLVAFTTICYLRDLLPMESFEKLEVPAIREDLRRTSALATRRSDTNKAQIDTSSPSQIGRSPKLGRMRVLARGQTAPADKLLLWLDGVFEALGRGVLDAIQLSIITDKENPSNVIESYTFTFSYALRSKGKMKALAGVVFSKSNGEAVTMRGALTDLGELRRHLTNVCETLPRLPVTRFLTLHLSYNNDCPIDYDPPGFLPAEADTMYVPDTDLWRMSRCWGGQMNSGCHIVSISMCHLSMTRKGDTEDDFIRIPSEIPCTRVLDRFAPRKDASNANPAGSGPLDNQIALEAKQPSQDANSTSGKEREGTVMGQNVMHNLKPTFDRGEIPDLGAARASSFNALINSPSRRGSLTPTQPQKWKLEFHKEGELHRKRAAVVQTVRQLSVREVSCHCGFGGEEGELVACNCCDKRQHAHCYGLINDQVSSVHVCYDCLLDDTEGDVLGRLVQLVQMRRILWFVLKSGFPNTQSDLAKTLHYNQVQVKSIISRLKKHGLVIDAPGSLGRGCSSKGLPKYVVVEGAVGKIYQQGGLLHFLSLISHHYEPLIGVHGYSPTQSQQQASGSSQRYQHLTDSEEDGTEDLSDIVEHTPSVPSQDVLQATQAQQCPRVVATRSSMGHQQLTVTPQKGRKRGLPMEELELQKCIKRARSPLDVSEET